ncbi:TetR family transcriptional regulator [Allonocardiopsis opalescens]|uniref:TetR family transcriptional regulator n=1 Tax=Allonocardiopsis opalescens TaxID=1144618 RepID=A0A2T0QDZ0_9ACTN|nr:TetR family transcriptional regulator [Allonocardiopsis opalescens]
MQAAAALASRGGVENMQMRTVAKRAAVAIGTLYRYFPSKMHLLAAVASEELALLEEGIRRRPPQAGDPAGQVVEVLMRAARGLMREPELADAVVRSLLAAGPETDIGAGVSRLVLRVSAGPGGGPAEPDHAELVLADSLAGVWVMELAEVLRGRRTLDQAQLRLEITARRLLG